MSDDTTPLDRLDLKIINELSREDAAFIRARLVMVIDAFSVATSDMYAPRWWTVKQEAHLYKCLAQLDERIREDAS